MKKILITGGTSGIGYSILRKFHEKDCMIYFTYSKNKYLAKKIEKKYKNTKSINLNLNSKSSINKLSKNIKDKLDCIILNAAQTLFVEKKNFRKFTPELFEKYVNVNLTDNFYLKAGYTTVDIITEESLGTGSKYGNTDTSGAVAGFGYNSELDNGMFIRAEATYTDFDSVSITSDTGVNTISVNNLHGVMGRVSVGKTF